MKLAYFSPLNPQPSGISDYSEELLPYLAENAEIDLFVEGFAPSNAELLKQFQIYDYQKNPEVLKRLPDFDAILYHLGNDHRYHTGMTSVMRRYPGVVVFHDFALQDFFLGQAHQQNDPTIYLDELEACHGLTERQEAELSFHNGGWPRHVNSPIEFPLNANLARSAEGIIVHSNWSRERLAAVAPNVPIVRINHHITARAAAAEPIAKSRNGTVQIASFGLITPHKGIERALRALAAMRDHNFHYTLCGPDGNFPGLGQLVASYGLSKRVSITGQVSLEEFERRIAEADIVINLRERPVGETSGSLCRVMAAGVPAIVSNVGAFSELPPNAVVKVDTDGYQDAILEAYLRKLIEDHELRRRIGQNARQHVLAEHNIERSAAAYLSFIYQVVDRRPRRALVAEVVAELSALGIDEANNTLLMEVANEVASLVPESTKQIPAPKVTTTLEFKPDTPSGNGHQNQSDPISQEAQSGRFPKVEGIDYKRSAVEYLRKLDPERSHHLRTKPFYNLRYKPAKYAGDGLDADAQRHFNDFANMAVTLALPAGARILDVGCGSGWLSEYFARLGYDVTGIDISSDLLQMSAERVEKLPYGVDHETPITCRFITHDIELEPLPTKFDAIICYDSLHHLENERAVFKHLAAMLDIGGLLFILEGHTPTDSNSEQELKGVMREFGTLESPFSQSYLRELLDENGFAIVGDYVSVNGLFEREMLEGDSKDPNLPLRTIATDYHYLTCMKVTNGEAPASTVPTSKAPGILKAKLTLRTWVPPVVKTGKLLDLPISVTNSGDTIWLTGQTVRAGVVMPGVRIFNHAGETVLEFHGQPMFQRAIAPGQSVAINIKLTVPNEPDHYTLKIDLVDQHVCWFEERGSEPIALSFRVED